MQTVQKGVDLTSQFAFILLLRFDVLNSRLVVAQVQCLPHGSQINHIKFSKPRIDVVKRRSDKTALLFVCPPCLLDVLRALRFESFSFAVLDGRS